jgi:general secretion pathway protein H
LPHCAPDPRLLQRAFTLIELLVVVAVVGILITMAVISFNLIGDDRAVQKQVLKLSSLIDLASEEAQMQGREYGLELMQGGFRFVEYDPFLDIWDEVYGDNLLRPRDLEEGMELELMLEDRRVSLQAQAKETQAAEDENERDRDLSEDYLPHILIMASGDITPFRLQVVRLNDESVVGLQLVAGQSMEVVADEQDQF